MSEHAPESTAPARQRIALVTGANTGIGRVTAIELARAGFTVFAACRSLERAQGVLEDIAQVAGSTERGQFLPLDLADLMSVRACAETFLARGQALDLLVNNAGMAGAHGVTAQGFELAFGVNHLGHFQLTRLLLPALRQAGVARVVTVASRAHRKVLRAPDWTDQQHPTRSWLGVHEYGVSKLANVLFSAELARRLHGESISTYAVHPGIVATEVWRHAPAWSRPLLVLRGMITVTEGAKTTLHCALNADARQSGLYWSESRPMRPARLGRDATLAQALWQASEAMVEGW